MTDNVDNTLLLNILREIRSEQNQHRTLLLQAGDYIRKMEQRLDGRIVALRDDLELMLKSELMGSLTHFQTKIENLLASRAHDVERPSSA
jgi:hypothetical protein